MLLILTSKDDLTADFLIARLLDLGKPYFRLNTDEVATSSVAFSVDGRMTAREIEVGGRCLDVDEVGAVWYRRRIFPRPTADVLPLAKDFVAREFRHLFEGLVIDPEVRWVNPFEAVEAAERKVYQLRLAASLGLRVPRTFISNDRARLIAEAERAPTGVVCKPISYGLISNGADRFAAYTRRVSPADLVGDLDQCPVFLQQEIPRGRDLRVTVIGEQLFAVSIEWDERGSVDWRMPGVQLRQEVCELPAELNRLCRELLRRLRLRFGALDFIQASTGEWYFLEVNATGEWAWLERELNLPMRDAFVDLFFTASGRRV